MFMATKAYYRFFNFYSGAKYVSSFKVEKTAKFFNQTHKIVIIFWSKKKKLLVSFLTIGIINKCAKFGEDICKRYRLKFGGVGCPFSTFLSPQGDRHCACAKKWCHFHSSFFTSFWTKKNFKELRPKIAKIASRVDIALKQLVNEECKFRWRTLIKDLWKHEIYSARTFPSFFCSSLQ